MADWLKEHYAIETIVPTSTAARQGLHRIIQNELSVGVFKPESNKYILAQMEQLQNHGAQSIILRCTEFPLVIKKSDYDLPLFDTTRIHSQMAADFILGKSGLAHVRSL